MATIQNMTITVTAGKVTITGGDGGSRSWDWNGKVAPTLHGNDRIVTTAANVWLDAGGSGTGTYSVTVA